MELSRVVLTSLLWNSIKTSETLLSFKQQIFGDYRSQNQRFSFRIFCECKKISFREVSVDELASNFDTGDTPRGLG